MEVDEDDDEPIKRIKPARARKPVKYDEDESTKSDTEVKASKSKKKIVNDYSSVVSDIIEDDEEEEEIKKLNQNQQLKRRQQLHRLNN